MSPTARPRVDTANATPDRLRTFRASDRLIGRTLRLASNHPYVVGSIALHALILAVLLQLPGLGEAERQRSAASDAVRVDRQVAQTEARELQRRVERMEEIERRLGGDEGAASSPASGPKAMSPEALAARARALSAAIDAADRKVRAATLARLTGVSPAEAERQLGAEAAASRPAAAATPAEIVTRLERRAQQTMEARRSQLAAKRNGVGVTLPTRAEIAAANALAASATGGPASGSTGQARAADGTLRSIPDQLKSMARLGPAQGRVGVNGAESGLSVNREGVKGVAGGRVVDERDTGPDQLSAATAPVTARGNSIDLTGNGLKGSHDLVRYVDPGTIDVATLHAGAGRVFGAGGAFATRVYLDSWYVIGPFAGRGEDSLDTVYPPEEDVDLDGVYRGLDGRVLQWRYASRGFYPFLPPDRAENAVYYAYTEVRIDQARDLWLSIGADDDSMLWLDGRRVWASAPGDKPWYHPPYYLRDEQVASLALAEGHRRVHLEAGVHRLLFKLFNDRDRTFFSVVLAP